MLLKYHLPSLINPPNLFSVSVHFMAEIIRQITKLASDLRLHGAGDIASVSSSAVSIASLAASLNFDSDYDSPGSDSSGGVLDAALSLMCFSSEQVAQTRVEYLVRTIIAVLNGSISCHVSETLHVGSSISPRDCNEIICLCKDVLIKLKGHNDGLADGLFSAILKNVTSLCYYKEENGEEISKEIINNVMDLASLVPDFHTSDSEIPFRVLKWYLDPSIFKHEISELVREVTQRPFICLGREFYENESWRDFILCLISSPTIFMNCRALLHSWFLQTGLNSILDCQNRIIHSLLDILSRPMRWRIPIETGLNFPFSHAYFPNKNRELFSILCGPISCSKFLELFDCINSELDLEPSFQTIDSDSSWALGMNFPNWFYFATIILFHKKDSLNDISRLLNDEISFEELDETKLIHASSQYLTWILNPIYKSKFNSLASNISNLSISWVKNKNITNRNKNITRTKKLSIRKVDEYETLSLNIWLKEFHGYCNNSSIYFKIPLGILITSFNSLDSNESELLLHFASTGELFDFKKDSNSKNWAIKGASLVLNLFDTIEEISIYLFEVEDARIEYLSRFKGKLGFYLIRCLKILLDMQGDRGIMLDLYKRLVTWKEDGTLDGLGEFGNVFNDLSLKYCS